MKRKKSIWTPVLIILSMIGAIFCFIMLYLNIAITPVDKSNTELQTITLESGNIKRVSSDLKKQGLIKDEFAFWLRAQLSGTAGKVGSGTYYLSKNMNADKIISILSKGNHDNTESVSVRILEGDTVEIIADKLYDANVIYDKEAFLNLCIEAENFIKDEAYAYLNEKNKDSKYIVEGYLFPDTYEFYFNSKPEDVISKLLNRFNELYTSEIDMAATQLGYSKKDVIILASIIQKEANTNDFSKVSAVLHNRLKDNMYLQCDSTIRYITNSENTMNLTSEQFTYNSPYNSYENKGLIPSPICSPSIDAIKAVVNPDKSFIDEKYLYFCSTDSSNSDLVFAKTYQEHLENVKQYKEYWEDYDKTVKSN